MFGQRKTAGMWKVPCIGIFYGSSGIPVGEKCHLLQ